MAMNLDFSPEDLAFREEVRAFVQENYPQVLREKRTDDLTKDEYLSWHKILAKKGWAAPNWPVEWGGTDWSITQKHLFNEVLADEETMMLLPFGLGMVGPVIYTFGSEAQKKRFLPPIVSGETWWCQGYSEPGSGSDLASLKTRAERKGDVYVVNGQKTWTTLAQFADWIFCLARTDANAAKPQMGISFLLIDMNTPGITVRPIHTLDGAHEVNEVYFDDVEVPIENLVGQENEGWTYAKFLLAHERTGIAGVARSRRALARLTDVARIEVTGDAPLIQSEIFSRKLADVEMELDALEITELRSLSSEASGRGPGPESSILKIKGSEIQQRISELTLEAVGHYGHPDVGGYGVEGGNAYPIGPDHAHFAAGGYFNMRKTSIYGGSNEIQRNIIAKMVLGL